MEVNYNHPYLIRQGLCGATFKKDGEELYLRMEHITKETHSYWNTYRFMSCQLVDNVYAPCIAGRKITEKTKDIYGLNESEFNALIEKALKMKENINNVGMQFLITNPGLYIVYATKNRDFSIQNTKLKDHTLKSFIESYGDLLITMGSDFYYKTENAFHNRGISRNPYWAFEGKYAGLSMLIQAFTGAVAEKFFPKKMEMIVIPVGSMQCLIKKNLLPGEGYMEWLPVDPAFADEAPVEGRGKVGEKIDITELTVSPKDGEVGMDHIKISALIRIYNNFFVCQESQGCY